MGLWKGFGGDLPHAAFVPEVDEFVLKTGFEAPDPEADPVDVIRSNAAKYIATLDLEAAGISTVIWANGYGSTLAGFIYQCSTTGVFPFKSKV